MKQRILALTLAFTLLLSVPVSAAWSGLPRTGAAYAGQLSDVTKDSPFYENIAALWEYGLTVGKADGSFGVKDNLTVGQTVIFAGRLRSLCATGDPEKGPAAFRQKGQAPYEPYLLYLRSVKALGDELDGTYPKAATRAVAAHILSSALPEEALAPTYGTLVSECYATGRFIPDVTEYTDYYQDILRLYRAGVLKGCDAQGRYYPASPISRGAMAAILTRLADPSLRSAPDWNLYSAKGATLGGLISGDCPAIAAPETEAELQSAIFHALQEEKDRLTLRYDRAVTENDVSWLLEAGVKGVRLRPEQCYNGVSCTYSPGGRSVEMIFTVLDRSAAEGQKLRQEFLADGISVHDRLWAEGKLREDMTEKEKARVLFDWVCANCRYDGGGAVLSHSGWSVFRKGLAVCDGYTAAYNLLLALEGIDCRSQINPDHMWTVATLDGRRVHIDVTWGDQDYGPDHALFAMTEQESYARHPW